MIILQSKNTNPDPHLVLIFGLGLIGTSLLSHLYRSGGFYRTHLPFIWESGKTQQAHKHEIIKTLTEGLHKLSKNAESVPRVTFIWSAGKEGFFSSYEDVEAELENFEVVVDMVKQMLADYSFIKPEFFFISSAGGLFEGQRFIDETSVECPKRPYGEMKLAQEKILLAFGSRLKASIFRLTSVYGISSISHRSGLIPTLLYNSFHNKVTRIYGNLNTLRDYVINTDIGRYISCCILNNDYIHSSSPQVLGLGKPCSIYEIIGIVENLTAKKVYLEFAGEQSNASDITFRQGVFPENWNPVSPKSGIRNIYLGMQQGTVLISGLC